MTFQHRFMAPKVAGAPMFLALHGTGGSENDLIPLVQQLAPDAGILAPRGRILENGAARFFRRFSEGAFDLENLREETLALADFVESAARNHGFDPQNVVAFGFSNGANIAASLLFLRPEILQNAILLRAQTPFEPQKLPDLTGKAVFIAAGRLDTMVAVENVENLSRILRLSGADVTLNWALSGHNLVGADFEALRVWMSEKL